MADPGTTSGQDITRLKEEFLQLKKEIDRAREKSKELSARLETIREKRKQKELSTLDKTLLQEVSDEMRDHTAYLVALEERASRIL